jgi:FeS assembly SUF system protein
MQTKTTSLDTSRLTHNNEPASPAPAAPITAPEPAAAPVPAAPLNGDEILSLKNDIVAALCTCFDPEIPVNIYELGLIYDIEIATEGSVAIRMTLTSPMCPAAGSLPGDVERKVRAVPRVSSVKVDVVWDPPWGKERMSEAAKLQLGIED